MTDKIARVCDYCGKTDVLNSHEASNGMITVQGGTDIYLLLMRDVRQKESGRPTFALTNKAYCLSCLPAAIVNWIEKVK